MKWFGNRRRRHKMHPSKGASASVEELFAALAVVASVVESVSESGARSADECKMAEDAVATLLDFCGF